jgi:opacity protein-like surface antigen
MRLIGALFAALMLACLAAPQRAQAQYWRDGYAPASQAMYRVARPHGWYGAYQRPYAWYPVGGVPAARPFYGAAYYTYGTNLVDFYTPYAASFYASPYVWPYGWAAFRPAFWPAWGFFGWGGCGC